MAVKLPWCNLVLTKNCAPTKLLFRGLEQMPRVIKGRESPNNMNGRRRKDEPFNPFAPNASQKARDRKEKTPRQPARPRTPEPKKPVEDLAAKQRAAMQALKQRRDSDNTSEAETVSCTA